MDPIRFNIFNKAGYLTDEERKRPIEHGCDYFRFTSCVDLSKGVLVIPYDISDNASYTIDQYSRDLASFMVWWTNTVWPDLNGFSGFSNVKFDVHANIIHYPVNMS